MTSGGNSVKPSPEALFTELLLVSNAGVKRAKIELRLRFSMSSDSVSLKSIEMFSRVFRNVLNVLRKFVTH